MISKFGWTPKPIPLNYDSLEGTEGFIFISGNSYGPVKDFSRIIREEHDDSEPIFNRLDTVSSCKGPADATSPALPYQTDWVFWVADAGIRGQSGVNDITPPANGSGSQSTLYPATTPTRLSAAFGDDGLLNIAIQKNETTIQINRYVDATTTAKVNFSGVSPAIFWTGTAATHYAGEDVVCYYLKEEEPSRVFARLLSEEYATEHVAVATLPVRLTSLIEVQVSLGVTKLFARDVDGRDITLATVGSSLGDEDESTLSLAIQTGQYFDQTLSQSDALDDLDPTGVPGLGDVQDLSLAIVTGVYGTNTVKPTGSNPKDKSKLGVSLLTGQYSKVV